MSQDLVEVVALVLLLVALTAAFQRALQPLLWRFLGSRLSPTPFATSAGAASLRIPRAGVPARRDAPDRLSSTA